MATTEKNLSKLLIQLDAVNNNIKLISTSVKANVSQILLQLELLMMI